MPTMFPTPLFLFGRDIAAICGNALNESVRRVRSDAAPLACLEEARVVLAHGIVLAVVAGVRAEDRLVKAALDHLQTECLRWTGPGSRAGDPDQPTETRGLPSKVR